MVRMTNIAGKHDDLASESTKHSTGTQFISSSESPSENGAAR